MANDKKPSSPHETTESYKLILDDHRELGELLHRVRELFSRQLIDRGAVRQSLAELNDRLRSHFELEEEGGYFRDLIAQAPRLKERTDELLRQHDALRQRVGRLIEIFDTADGTDVCWPSCVEEFEQFFQEFCDHESRENRLMQEAYNQDIGDKD